MLGTLLSEIYTQYQWTSGGLQTPSFDSNVYDDYVLQDNCLVKREPISHLTREQLEEKSVEEIQTIIKDLKLRTKEQSTKLVHLLKRRDQGKTRQKRGYALLTRLLQTVFRKSKSNGIPSRLKFCMPAPSDARQFNNWLDALRAVAQLAPYGIDPIWRPEVWLGCAEHNYRDVEWSSVLKFAFNEKLNPDDHMLGVQIVKDLYRTGSCRLLSPSDDRAALKRVLLGYARWNKEVGYCQGFNIITAVLLKVLNNNEAAALKVMIQVVENLLPEHYFNNNLVALSVDLAVFRELLRVHVPRLWAHITKLQGPVSKDPAKSDITYEPPLTNVFTMQWFLTLFATCLPNEIALKVWDLIFLYGAEVLFRVALAIWSSLQTVVLTTHTCDEFYMQMSTAVLDIRQGRHITCEELMKKIHSIPPLSQEKLQEFREEIMYNIQPPNLGLYAKEQDVHCMSLLLNSNPKEVIPTKPEHSKPSLRETIKKREVEVTSRDIQTLLADYRNKTKKQKLKTKQPGPATAIRCVPDLGLRRKLPEKAFSFDTAELSTRQILLQQVSGFSPSQRPNTPRKASFPALNHMRNGTPTSRKCLFSDQEPESPTTASTNNSSSSFSLVTDALAHIRISRIPDTQTEEFCNSGYSLQRPIPEKQPSGIQAQTQSYNQDISPLPKPDSLSDDQDETLTEVYFMEGEDLDTTTDHDTSELSAEQKRKQWLKKSKTISTLVYKSKDGGGGAGGGAASVPSSPRPFSPYKPSHFSFDNGYSSSVQQSNSLLVKQTTNRDSETQGSTFNNVTRVVHAGLSSDPYFNLRKNQAFLADMHSWSLANATSLPFMVDNRDRKRSK
ncbi:uncharacterized protein LOC134820067 [Bolinopsis microptera]|uniref:uncharacterized protein LOC134820067 n=1 Tax=Bolinopsis microptera TaxID=2820187 RepID=UPI00307A0AA1